MSANRGQTIEFNFFKDTIFRVFTLDISKYARLQRVSPSQIWSQSDPILAAAVAKVAQHFGALDAEVAGVNAGADTRDNEDHFVALCGIVAGQQLSTSAARAIRTRLAAHFGSDFSPAIVAQTPHETLRGLGLSGAKARTLHALAAHVLDGNLQIARLEQLSDEEIAREIVAVKGLGPWRGAPICF